MHDKRKRSTLLLELHVADIACVVSCPLRLWHSPAVTGDHPSLDTHWRTLDTWRLVCTCYAEYVWVCCRRMAARSLRWLSTTHVSCCSGPTTLNMQSTELRPPASQSNRSLLVVHLTCYSHARTLPLCSLPFRCTQRYRRTFAIDYYWLLRLTYLKKL